MDKGPLKSIFVVFVLIGFSLILNAQEQTGSIRGYITDTNGSALPGITVTASSEALMGTNSYVSTKTGAFRFPALPPGIYLIACQCPGFKTLTRRNIVVRVGKVVTLNVTMEMATIEEEVTVTAASPTVDVKQTKISIVMDRDMLKDTPMARDLYDIVNFAPGAISEEHSLRRTTSVHGSTVRGNTYALDGVNMNDPSVSYPITNVNFDVMAEVELEVGAHPASVGYTDGAYVNIVTRSGGNRFSGGATLYYTEDSLSQSLWTNEQVKAFGVAQPEVDKSWIDGSLSLGGPIINDKLWFFSNGRFIKQEKAVSYVPWTDILGRFHDLYDWTHEEWLGFLKLTTQLTSKIKLIGMFNFVQRYRPVWGDPNPTTNFIATKIWDHERTYTGNGSLNYLLDQNTFFDFKVSYIRRWLPLLLQEEAQDLPFITDRADNYGSLTSGTYNETYLRKRFQTGVYFTRFQDGLLAASHEFKGGVEFEDVYTDKDYWRKDNLVWYWYGSPYYYGGNEGQIGFYICGPERGSTKRREKTRRIGAYIQDSATFGNRLTLNVGLRYDRSWAWLLAVNKAASGNPLSVWLGENVLRPYIAADDPEHFPDGLNPWGELAFGEWKNVMVWNSLSPRIGLTFDVFGDGKTAFKASFSRYTEYMMVQYFSAVSPIQSWWYGFDWIDTNYNGQPDQDDTFYPWPEDYRIFDLEFAKKSMIDPDTKSPLTDELTVGVWHEFFRNFSLGFNFIYKNKKNILEDGFYSPDTDEWWYSWDQPAAKKYYIPFNTTVPSEVYGDVDITFYVQKLPPDAPNIFWRFANIPEFKRRYWAFEFLFNKRMADGWQLAGSIIYSKAYGNLGGWFTQSSGYSASADGANTFINKYGRLNIDRPLQIKLMGTARLPYRIFLSTYYVFFSGSPWRRDVYIRPPRSWTTPRNAWRTYYFVRLEPNGTRRNRARNRLDLRLEKEFWLGDFGTLSFYVDVFNALGWSGLTIGENDVYRWRPDDEGFDQPGSLIMDPYYQYISEVEGRRTVKFSLRFSF